MDVRVGSKDLIREINERLVLDAVRTRGTVARSEIAEITGLSPATVTGIARRLVETSMLAEVSRGQSTGGRRPRMLALDSGGVAVIGVWLALDRVVAVAVNLVGDVIDECSVALRGKSLQTVERAVVRAARSLIARTSSSVIGVGITLSGMVDSRIGLVRHSGLFGWEDAPLGDLVASHLGLPIVVDNLVNALASAFVLFGEGRDGKDQLVVSVGHSIGMGLVLDGRVRHGLSGPTGSLGHTSVSLVEPGDKLCHCGMRGCLETVASEWALQAEFEAFGVADVEVAAARAEHDESLQRVFSGAGRALAGAVANAAKVINPDRIVLCGEGTRLGPPFIEPFRKELYRSLVDTADPGIAVQVVRTDAESLAHGAACQALTRVFQVSSY